VPNSFITDVDCNLSFEYIIAGGYNGHIAVYNLFHEGRCCNLIEAHSRPIASIKLT
jgi:hypothetical protein